MITSILFSIIVTLFGYFKWIKKEENLFERVFQAFMICFMSLFVGIFLAKPLPMQTCEVKRVLKISSLQDNSQISGDFFLGSGSVDGKMKYCFYTEENGLFTFNKINTDNAKIKYTDGQPQITIYTKGLKKSWINWFAIDFDLDKKTYLIEVPKGTVNNNYNLDTQ